MSNSEQVKLLLASTSPRRQALLAQLGISFSVFPVDVDETVRVGEIPGNYVRRMAQEKAELGWNNHVTRGQTIAVVGADTAVILDESILGKPRDKAHGLEMLTSLAGRSHQVLTAVAVCKDGTSRVALSCSEVRFRSISEWEREAYWATGEPLDKAGGYGIQGIGAVFVEHIAGSYSGVMGLPIYETTQLLGDIGISVFRDASL